MMIRVLNQRQTFEIQPRNPFLIDFGRFSIKVAKGFDETFKTFKKLLCTLKADSLS